MRFYGFYSNKKRGMRRDKSAAAVPGQPEPDTAFRRKCRMTWAALIKCVYEAMHRACRGVDPLKCPRCGGEMRIISFIEQELVIEKILRHCGLWRESPTRAPPIQNHAPPVAEEPKIEYGFFEQYCA